MLRICLFALALLAATLTIETVAQAPKQPTKKKKAAVKKEPVKRDATPAEALYVPDGFKVELLHTADPVAEGSFICMTRDDKGRLIISGQRNQPILRVTLKDGKVAAIDKVDLPITEAMGLLHAFGSLYVNGAGPKGFGLYRCTDSTGSGTYDDVRFLKRFDGGGEHGPHGIAVGPDKKLYIINGNHTRVPEGMSAQSPHRNYREDLLLPRQWDGNGHAAGVLAPGGYVVRTDADGKDWELVLAGFRNAYDHAFNPEGELFTFDSDMEWDWGMPWYRPVRVNHCTSAAEFGWRSGTGKWPAYYADSLPALVDIGIGSPTGVEFGTGARFPAKYQKALYVLDWSYGRILAVHLKPDGSSYTGSFENFVAPLGLVKQGGPRLPLNVTDMVIGADGAMYFTVGGRNTQAALYRVSYHGKESTVAAPPTSEGASERARRRQLEKFHGKVDAVAIEAAWPHLSSPDRYLRFAARLAVESQPVATWQGRALAEKQPLPALTALLALARTGDAKALPELLAALARLPIARLPVEQQLDKLRVYQLAFLRLGRPSVQLAAQIITEVDGIFPATDERVNREAVQVLVYLHAPGVVAKTLRQMATARSQPDMIHYLFHLRTMPIGFWTMAQRREYFGYWAKDRKKYPRAAEMDPWFVDAGRPYSDGASYANFMRNFLREAVANLSDAEQKELAGLLDSIDKAAVANYEVKPRKLVKQWKVEELLPQLSKVERGRNFDRGKEAYLAGQCIKCHRFGDEGGAVGPELTAIATRYSRRDILESIVDPSRVISDQYQHVVVTTVTGKSVIGRLVDETPERIAIQPDPLSPARVEIPKGDIETRDASKVSPMPAHLVDVLTAEEIFDLIAYLESAGRKGHRAFGR